MSIRIDTTELISDSLVIGNVGLGVLGSTIPSDGDDGAGYLYNDLSFPEDSSKEVRGLILTTPAAGIFFAYEDSSFTFSDAPDGEYSFTYQLYIDGIAIGSQATVTLSVGLSTMTINTIYTTADAVGYPSTVTLTTTVDTLYTEAFALGFRAKIIGQESSNPGTGVLQQKYHISIGIGI